jgi:hypothetical protein
MFEENLYVHDGRNSHYLTMHLGLSGALPMVFQFWAAELARDVLRLGVYFHAAAIFLQIPGASAFELVRDDLYEEEQDIDYEGMIGTRNKHTLLDVLARCLDRLGAKSLMAQLTAERHIRGELPPEWTVVLERRAKIENGLLSVVADCLDALIVRPGMEEIEQADEPHWWHRFRAKMGPFEEAD